MKRVLLALVLFIAAASVSCCSKGGASSSGFLGNWKASLIVGQGDLSDIQKIKIEKSTITVCFEEGGHYGALYEAYGPSHSVHYTSKANDVDSKGEQGTSLTFDEPLYFVEYSLGNDYISKVFIKKVEGGKILWWDDLATHSFSLSK